MWTNKIARDFDATVWKGPINLTTAAVRLSMLLMLGGLWFCLAAWIYF
ncbi:MAG: hypothetical protein ACR2QJ_12570 [Geminicoccaceae bacterium]